MALSADIFSLGTNFSTVFSVDELLADGQGEVAQQPQRQAKTDQWFNNPIVHKPLS